MPVVVTQHVVEVGTVSFDEKEPLVGEEPPMATPVEQQRKGDGDYRYKSPQCCPSARAVARTFIARRS
jgi:hypothetical protein